MPDLSPKSGYRLAQQGRLETETVLSILAPSRVSAKEGEIVCCPYKRLRFLSKASGNAGRATVHIAFDEDKGDKGGIGPVSFGDTPFEAKLSYLRDMVQYEYFHLSPDLTVSKPLLF